MPDDTSRAAHEAHEDRHEQAALERIATLRAHEDHAREDAKTRAIAPLTQEPDASVITDHMDAPGDEDDGCFSGFPGDVV